MAISVEGYGNITQGNAKEIYTAWKRGEVDLNPSQQKKCESFLSPEEIDEVQYDEKVTEKRGKDSINTENTEGKANVAGGASTATAAGAVATILFGKALSSISGFSALAASIIAVACAAITFGLSFAFDAGNLSNRNEHSQNAANDNETMDTYTDALTSSMDMMNEDVEHYKETQDTLTTTVNTQVSQGADLQMQYDAAVAMGDTNGAQSLKEQMKVLSETDNSQLEDDLAETGEGIEEYRSMNAEALGCAESGQTVSDFLKDGKPQGVLAMVNGALCTVGALAAGIAAVLGAIPKIWILGVPTDLPCGLSAAVFWGTVSVMMGGAATNFFKKGNQEFECASNGEEMQTHVDTLNDMAAQQTTYTDDTEGQFAESDEAAAESKEGAAEKAGKAVAGNKEGLANKPNEEEKEEPAGAAA